MKIRSGFVSNSSSSSFIVGVALVSDINKLKEYLTQHGIEFDNYSFFVCSVKEVKDNKRYSVTFSKQDKHYVVEVDSFEYGVHLNLPGGNQNQKLLVEYL